MMRDTARVIVGDQVWSVRKDSAARWALMPNGCARPLSTDDADTTAAKPVWLNGDPIPGCVRWATPADMAALAMLTAGAEQVGGRS